MKATIDIPDLLYRQVKAKSALEGQPIRLVAIDLFSAWVKASPEVKAEHKADVSCKAGPLPPWFGVARSFASKVHSHDMDAVRESVALARSAK